MRDGGCERCDTECGDNIRVGINLWKFWAALLLAKVIGLHVLQLVQRRQSDGTGAIGG